MDLRDTCFSYSSKHTWHERFESCRCCPILRSITIALGHHRIVADALVLPYFLTGERTPPYIGRSPAPHVDKAAQRVGSAEASSWLIPPLPLSPRAPAVPRSLPRTFNDQSINQSMFSVRDGPSKHLANHRSM